MTGAGGPGDPAPRPDRDRPDPRVLVVHGRYRSDQPSGENLVVEREVDLLRRGEVAVELHQRSSDEIARWSLPRRATLPARVVWSPTQRAETRAAIRRFAPTVVHVHNTFPLLSPSVLAACSDEGVPVVMTLHNFRLTCANGILLRDGRPCEDCVGRAPVPALRHGCYRDSRAATLPVATLIAVHRVLRTHARHVGVFVALTTFARDVMVRAGLPPARLAVKPNSVPDPARRRSGGPGHHLLFLGRLEPEKGFDLVLEAWRNRPGGAPGTLVIAGDGSLRADAEAAAAADPAVRYLGRRTPEQVGELLAGARALLLPSRWYEGLPLSLLEAFAAGVGAVVPDHGPFPELAGDRERPAALRIPPGDAGALARAMTDLLADDDLVLALGVAARRAYEARYTPARNLARLLELYRDVSPVPAPATRLARSARDP